MTYAGFLFWFLIIPLVVLSIIALRDRARDRQLPSSLQAFSPVAAILLHALIALLYTTLWDNYLVATGVWWYDPELVLGITFGYVPLEEYTFFLLQPLVAGLWLLFLLRRISNPSGEPGSAGMRLLSVIAAAAIWLAAAAVFVVDWQPGTYLALELVWAVPPIALQLAFGADILWRYRRPVLAALLSLTIYLSLADALAISYWGIWTISPEQSTDFLLGGVLPVEEFLFFFLTNTLVVFGITLVLSQESHSRIRALRRRLSARPTNEQA